MEVVRKIKVLGDASGTVSREVIIADSGMV
jgi:hypothetical protein